MWHALSTVTTFSHVHEVSVLSVNLCINLTSSPYKSHSDPIPHNWLSKKVACIQGTWWLTTKVIPVCLPDNSSFGGFRASEATGKLVFCIIDHYQNCQLNSDCKIFVNNNPKRTQLDFQMTGGTYNFWLKTIQFCSYKLCKFDEDIFVRGYMWNPTRLLL